jgi:osmotically-inducible protein OsmY
MTPTMLVTDEWIQEAILAELKWEGRVQPTEIGVAVQDGIVALSGRVDSYAKRWAAEEAAHRVLGVRAVANDVEVRLSPDDQRTDPDLAAAVTRALAWDTFVPLDKLDITVSGRWVTLLGVVDRPYQKLDAEQVVRRLLGVRGVTNLITVRHGVVPAEVQQQIEEALLRSAETDAQRITVEVQETKVVLHGAVHSWAEQEAARWAALSAPGVTEVESRLTIVPVGKAGQA